MHELAAAWRAEIRRRLAFHALGASTWALLAVLCALGDRHVVMLSHDSGVHEVAATVVATPRRGADRYLTLAYVRRDGTRGIADEPAWYAPDAGIGDRVAYLYSARDPSFARPLNSGERVLRLTLRGFAIALAAGALGWLGLAAMQAWRRLRLVRHGERLPAQALAVQQGSVPVGRGGHWPRWRLRAAWYDGSLPGWREVRSSWHLGRAPDHLPADALILRDPGTRHAWLPLPPSVQARGVG